MNLSFKPIQPLLQTGTNTLSRWLSYIGLGIGVLLLLIGYWSPLPPKPKTSADAETGEVL